MSTKRIMSAKIEEALRRHGLSLDTRLREYLEQNAFIGGGQPDVRILHDGSDMTIDQTIDHVRSDPNFGDCFPPEPRRVSRHDPEAIQKEFDSIAKGTTVVV